MTLMSAVMAAAIAASTPAQRGQQALTPMSPREAAFHNLQGFNIVLLVGESQSSGSSIDDVPPAARKALNDMRDFLPFKHYRVLDSQWTVCCGEQRSSVIAGQVQGVASTIAASADAKLYPRTYHFLLQVTPSGPRLSVHFSLMPEGSSARSAQNTNLSAAREAELDRRLWDLRKELDTLDDEIPRRTREGRLASNHPEIAALEAQRSRVQQRIAETVNQLSSAAPHPPTSGSSRPLVDSSFTMDVGETVVVGTSRLGGDKALIAIVTAVRKGSAAR